MRPGMLFSESTHVEMLRRIRLIRVEDRREALKRVVIAIVAAWAPLVLFAVALGRPEARIAFLIDAAVHARFLLAVPVFIVADYIVLPRLDSIGRYFGTTNLVPPDKHAAYDALLASSRRLSTGVWPSGVLAIIVYAIVALMVLFVPRDSLPTWQINPQGTSLSVAGFWHLLVSLPLLLGLMLAWLWRLGVWFRFLAGMARMHLRLIAAHPDQAGGLQFLGYTPRIFASLALAFAIVTAGPLANKVIHGASPIGHEITPGVTVIVMLLLFGTPPLVFSHVLQVTWRAGVYYYGDLAARMGEIFEKRWFTQDRQMDNSALERPDFSSTTDLYGIVANVFSMRQAIFDIPSLLGLIAATLLPFAPIWLSAIPFETIVDRVVDMLF